MTDEATDKIVPINRISVASSELRGLNALHEARDRCRIFGESVTLALEELIRKVGEIEIKIPK